AEGVTVFVTTHYMDEAEYCNRLALIFRGRLIALGTPTELKRDAVKGEILMLDAQPLGSALEALKGTAGISDVAVFGNALHLVVEDAETATDIVRRAMEMRGIPIARLERIRPGLEDAFAALTAATPPASSDPERRAPSSSS